MIGLGHANRGVPPVSPARVLAAVVGASALVLGIALPAAAHVTINPTTASGGGYQKLTVRVPDESATASTVGLEITFPTDKPLASARVKSKAGWTANAVTKDLPAPVQVHGATLTKDVHPITWQADGDGIAPDTFDEFEVSVGPLPADGRLVFSAAQTYSDGTARAIAIAALVVAVAGGASSIAIAVAMARRRAVP